MNPKDIISKVPFSVLRPSKDDVIVLGVIALALLLGTLLVWDAIVFYRVVRSEQYRTVSEPTAKASIIIEKDIDDAIKILDARKERFDAAINQK